MTKLADKIASDMAAWLKSDACEQTFGSKVALASDETEDSCDAHDHEDTVDHSDARDEEDCDMAKDSTEDCTDADDSSDEDDNMAEDEKVSVALNTALSSLLTASAALDSVGFEKSASLSLEVASFISEAKKTLAKKPGKKAPAGKKFPFFLKKKKTDKKEDSKSSASSKKDSSKSSSSASSKKDSAKDSKTSKK